MEFTNSHGVQFNYRVQGEGPAVVVVHGYGGSPVNWQPVVADLSKSFKCYSLNLTKLYYSRSKELSMEVIINTLNDFVNYIYSIEGAKIYLCGNSFGATLLQAVVLRSPSCVKKFVLVGPMPQKPLWQLRDPILRLITVFGKFKSLNYFLLKSWLGGILYPYLAEIWRITDTPRKSHPTVKTWKDFGERKIRLLVHAITRFCDLNADVSWSKLFPKTKKISCKCLIIWGGYDRLWRFGTPERLQRLFSNCQLNYVHNAGHLVMTDQPKVCAEYIELFLKDHPHSR